MQNKMIICTVFRNSVPRR